MVLRSDVNVVVVEIVSFDSDFVDALDDDGVVDEDVDDAADEDGEEVGEGEERNDQSLLRLRNGQKKTLFRPAMR